MYFLVYTLQLTFRCFDPTGGADVGVIVTDGVIVKFELVLDDPPNDVRSGGPPGVNVAPPGNDERGGGVNTELFGRPGDIWPLLICCYY